MTITKDAINALDYTQNDWKQKDGRESFNESCEKISAALTRLAELEKAADGMAETLEYYAGQAEPIGFRARQALAAYRKLKGEK